MPVKIAVDKKPVSKPGPNGIRSQLSALEVGQFLQYEEHARPGAGECAEQAANRTSKQLRNRLSRSVTDARQATGHTFTTSSTRRWDNDHFVCSLLIRRTA